MIMVARFIKLNILIIILFCNKAVFGMMSKNLSPLEDENLIHEIVSNCSFNKQLELRLVCKTFANQDKIFVNICKDYYDKQTSMACVLLNYVHKNDHKKVEWFVNNNQVKILCVVHNFHNDTKWLSEYHCIDPRCILPIKNEYNMPINAEMKDIFSKYSDKDFFKSIQAAQKKITEQGYFNQLMQRRDACINENIGLNALLYRTVFLTNKYINDNLVIMACSGNIDGFNKELNKHNKFISENSENNEQQIQEYKKSINCQQNMSLVWLAALENGDISFINNLLLHQDYKDHIQDTDNRNNLLSFLILNTAIENVQNLKLDDNIIFSKNRINKVIKLINLGFLSSKPPYFSSSIPFIDNNKNNNSDINKISEALKQQIFYLVLQRIIQEELDAIEEYLNNESYEKNRIFIQEKFDKIEQAFSEDSNDNGRILLQKKFNQIKNAVLVQEKLYQTKRNNEMCPIQ
jgi:uncharacterized protein YcgL (UPF0745 family)